MLARCSSLQTLDLCNYSLIMNAALASVGQGCNVYGFVDLNSGSGSALYDTVDDEVLISTRWSAYAFPSLFRSSPRLLSPSLLQKCVDKPFTEKKDQLSRHSSWFAINTKYLKKFFLLQ